MRDNLPLKLQFLVLAMGGVACFDSGGSESVLRDCLEVDSVGCCGAVSERRPVEESCPAGTVGAGECRSAGCDPTCTPLECRVDVGDACCGARVSNTSCESCPAGSIPASSCTGDFPTECGCDDRIRRRPSTDAGPVVDAGAPDAFFGDPPSCFEDIGGGCCGDSVPMDACGCPPGSIMASECLELQPATEFCFAAVDGVCCREELIRANACGFCPEGAVFESMCALGSLRCRVDLGGGCCGSQVLGDPCDGGCPPGTVPEDSCGAVQRGVDEFPAPPADAGVGDPDAGPISDAGVGDAAAPTCFVRDTCEEVAFNACGECPAGSNSFCEMPDAG
ncbi:MAG: hypothetical protein AAF938_24515 [Myxococcota bacterium]